MDGRGLGVVQVRPPSLELGSRSGSLREAGSDVDLTLFRSD